MHPTYLSLLCDKGWSSAEAWRLARPHRRLPDLWTIVSYWAERDDLFYVELEHPNCFACGRTYGMDDIPEPRDRWIAARSKLERGHLVNRARDGLDGPQNLVPLCGMCNKSMPIFSRPDPAIEWVLDGGWTQYFDVGPEGELIYRRDRLHEICERAHAACD
jgi:hypothetical protein